LIAGVVFGGGIFGWPKCSRTDAPLGVVAMMSPVCETLFSCPLAAGNLGITPTWEESEFALPLSPALQPQSHTMDARLWAAAPLDVDPARDLPAAGMGDGLGADRFCRTQLNIWVVSWRFAVISALFTLFTWREAMLKRQVSAQTPRNWPKRKSRRAPAAVVT